MNITQHNSKLFSIRYSIAKINGETDVWHAQKKKENLSSCLLLSVSKCVTDVDGAYVW